MAAIDINAPDLAAQVERLSVAEIDALPFGVILIDRDNTVVLFNATEARQTGYRGAPLGQNFFAVALGKGAEEFRARLAQAQAAGPVDLEFGWKGDYADPKRDLRIRVQSARNGGVWLFIERD